MDWIAAMGFACVIFGTIGLTVLIIHGIKETRKEKAQKQSEKSK